jgi:hypothetical protein
MKPAQADLELNRNSPLLNRLLILTNSVESAGAEFAAAPAPPLLSMSSDRSNGGDIFGRTGIFCNGETRRQAGVPACVKVGYPVKAVFG